MTESLPSQHQGLLRSRPSLYSASSKLLHGRNLSFSSLPKGFPFYTQIRVLRRRRRSRDGAQSLCFQLQKNTDVEQVEEKEKEIDQVGDGSKESDRPPFDINLAVILAGFAFEAYWSPPENVGKREVDGADCETVYLSGSFLREIYDGQLFVKLKKGYDFPAMDPWGTSDPYVIVQLESQVVKSKVKWGTKRPTWNEELTLNVKQLSGKSLEVAAWDANLITPHKRMGNARVNLDCLCDGEVHEVLVELDGMGGGGKIQLEVEYKSFDEIDKGKKWWKVPFFEELLRQSGLEFAYEKFVGSEAVQARQFVKYAFGQLNTLNDAYSNKKSPSVNVPDCPSQLESGLKGTLEDDSSGDGDAHKIHNDDCRSSGSTPSREQVVQSDKDFWKNLAETINQTVLQKLGVPVTEIIKWDGLDLLVNMSSQSRKNAEAGYIESGLATAESHDTEDGDNNYFAISGTSPISTIQSLKPDIKRVMQDMVRQTDSILGALMVLSASVSTPNKDTGLAWSKPNEDASNGTNDDVSTYFDSEILSSSPDGSLLSKEKAKEMKALFLTAESAMEAWAMLATSLGQPTFIKSEFEKLCFLDNPSTDTQVAIWRDSVRKRLVIAFRGTEQARWKDLRTDLMLVPAGLNPERIGGDFKQEVQVHSGFLGAYDSVRTRIMSLIKSSINFVGSDVETVSKWHVYVTGHSLGGALATLLALELSSSQLVKQEAIYVTMYNFGSPRVGNKRFAEVYNEKVKDSWRVVNHRDIIPSLPRLMGYCHVAQPIYLAAGNQNAMENVELLEDGYQGDMIGESTPDVIVSEFMKGEKELIERLLQTEINIFRSIRDGTALMQHMEDFYYITLLENVRSNYQIAARSTANEEINDTLG